MLVIRSLFGGLDTQGALRMLYVLKPTMDPELQERQCRSIVAMLARSIRDTPLLSIEDFRYAGCTGYDHCFESDWRTPLYQLYLLKAGWRSEHMALGGHRYMIFVPMTQRRRYRRVRGIMLPLQPTGRRQRPPRKRRQ